MLQPGSQMGLNLELNGILPEKFANFGLVFSLQWLKLLPQSHFVFTIER